MKPDQCRAKVHDDFGVGFHRCTRRAVRDGFCTQHHPDQVKKRKVESDRREDERWKESPLGRLMALRTKIDKCEAIVAQVLERGDLTVWERKRLTTAVAILKGK